MKLLVAALLLGLSCHAFGQGFDHSHASWSALLKKHVVLIDGGKASQVRYAALAKEQPSLKAYLDELSAVTAAEFAAWPRARQMAFLINAYNAYTVQKVLTRYPEIRSIWDFGKLFSNPFRDPFFVLLGARASLDRIEHDILRRHYRDARIHFAVNCASVGCPMLREEAYVEERLEQQLDEQAARFLSDRSRNRVAGGRLEVSRIFDWYKEDFEPRPAYFGRHAHLLSGVPAEQGLIRDGKLQIAFLDYDWTLNDAR